MRVLLLGMAILLIGMSASTTILYFEHQIILQEYEWTMEIVKILAEESKDTIPEIKNQIQI